MSKTRKQIKEEEEDSDFLSDISTEEEDRLLDKYDCLDKDGFLIDHDHIHVRRLFDRLSKLEDDIDKLTKDEKHEMKELLYIYDIFAYELDLEIQSGLGRYFEDDDDEVFTDDDSEEYTSDYTSEDEDYSLDSEESEAEKWKEKYFKI